MFSLFGTDNEVPLLPRITGFDTSKNNGKVDIPTWEPGSNDITNPSVRVISGVIQEYFVNTFIQNYAKQNIGKHFIVLQYSGADEEGFKDCDFCIARVTDSGTKLLKISQEYNYKITSDTNLIVMNEWSQNNPNYEFIWKGLPDIDYDTEISRGGAVEVLKGTKSFVTAHIEEGTEKYFKMTPRQYPRHYCYTAASIDAPSQEVLDGRMLI